MTPTQQLVQVLNAGMDGLSMQCCDPAAVELLMEFGLVYPWYSHVYEETYVHAYQYANYFRLIN